MWPDACCHAFLKDFESISVNMAKEQGLLLILTRLQALAVDYCVVCAMSTTGTARRLPTCQNRVAASK